MAKQKPLPPGKTRTRAHVIADLGLHHTEGYILRCGFTLQRIHSDYGYDYLMWTYNERGEIENGVVYFQIKATDRLPLLDDSKTIAWRVSRRDIRLWLKEAYPVALVVYDASSHKAYWLYVQAYFSERPTTELFSAGETTTVYIPTRNRVSQASIQKIARWKHAVDQQLFEKVHHHV